MVNGLLGAMFGVPRGAGLPVGVSLDSMSIRLDRPGSVMRDFQTINPFPASATAWLSPKDQTSAQARVRKKSGAWHTDAIVTDRFYREDSEILVFIDDASGLVHDAALAPEWTLYAGRKSCPLAFPFLLGRVGGEAHEAASVFPSTAPEGDIKLVAFANATNRATEAVPLPQEPLADGFATRTSFVSYANPPRIATWLSYLEQTCG